jgi:hypothetical protein
MAEDDSENGDKVEVDGLVLYATDLVSCFSLPLFYNAKLWGLAC